MSKKRSSKRSTLSPVVTLSTLMVILAALPATAQTTRNSDGSVRVDNGAFDIRTGTLENDSQIPLPTNLIDGVRQGVAQPVDRSREAPNSVDFNLDVDDLNGQLNEAAPGFTLQEESLEMTTQFNLSHRPGSHAYAEGIRVTVKDENGNVKSQETVFVRGDGVTRGPDGQPLPPNAQLNVQYGANDTVTMEVLNVRSNGASESDSGIYFLKNGEFVVEDLQNGGDLDFDDGKYVSIPGGSGAARVQNVTQTVTTRTEVIETPMAPLTRQTTETERRDATQVTTGTQQRTSRDQVVTEGTIVDKTTAVTSGELVTQTPATQVEVNRFNRDTVVSRQYQEVQRDRRYGQMETPRPQGGVLPHATSATTEDAGLQTTDEGRLVDDKYNSAREGRLGSDGATLTFQTRPLNSNPAAPPTLLQARINVDPSAGVNQPGLTVTVGAVQFLNPTHRDSTDMFGNLTPNPNPDGPRLVQPTGLWNNTQIVGYVPPTPERTVPGERISSVNGVFHLPSDKGVVIAPPNPNETGRGDSGYTDNVGGLIIERQDGSFSFVPQWTKDGFEQQGIMLQAGEATRVIYALVPQQAGQNLKVGQQYSVTRGANGAYSVSDGGSAFNVISADLHPQNFLFVRNELYAVEDTLRGTPNATIPLFNGVPGVYRQYPGGPFVSTTDINDGFLGNLLQTPDVTIPGQPGQNGYFRTTRTGGLYIRGAFTLGLGNQEDVITTTTTRIQEDRKIREEVQQTRTTPGMDTTTTEFRDTHVTTTSTPYQDIAERVTTETDQIRTTDEGYIDFTRVDQFATPRTGVTTNSTDVTTTVTETRQATFDINAQGRMENLQTESLGTTTSQSEGPTTSLTEVRLGAEALMSSNTTQGDRVSTGQRTEVTGSTTDVQVGESRRQLGDSTSTTESTRETGASTTTFNATGQTVVQEQVLSATELQRQARILSRHTTTERDRYPNFTPVVGEAALGFVYNFGNTPWTPAANTVALELFANGVVLGRVNPGSSHAGIRAELILNPFGEEQRPAYRVTADGKVEPLFKTRPVLDAQGNQVYTTLVNARGETMQVAVNEFVRDDKGELVQETTGTGRPSGPQFYVRAQYEVPLNPLSGDERGSANLHGGLRLSF
jgi:hypothetical protein